MTNVQTFQEQLTAEPVSREELQRILAVQRVAFLKEGSPTAEVRRNRIDRLSLAILEYADELAEALNLDYGQRPAALTKAFDVLAWLPDAEDLRENLEEWMKPVQLTGGFIQQKPLGVVGVIGAWNFPLDLTIQPALAALAAGNRVFIKFPDFHVRTGRVLAEAVSRYFGEDEVAVVTGDLQTAQAFSDLEFDKIIFTGSPAVGKVVATAAARNLVPVILELGGKNPVVVAHDADLDLAARRVAGTRVLNGGQICLCPDYVFVPREHADELVRKVSDEFMALYPDYLNNPGVVSIVNDRNYDRVVGLIDDAVAKGARMIEVANPDEADALPSRAGRRIAPTLLLDVPESAKISSEEIFGPVLSVYPYDDIHEVIEYVNTRPSPLAAYWYGGDSDEFRLFLDHTTSGGVARNDGLIHASLHGAGFGGVGNSGTGAYHGKAGFDEFTHRRTVAVADESKGVSDGLVGRILVTEEFMGMVDLGITASIASIKARLGK